MYMMNGYLIQICLVVLCVLEVLLCYVFVSHMVRLTIKPSKLELLVVIIGILLVGGGLGFHRNILFFANNVWIWTMILSSAWMLIVLRRNIIETIELVVVYYSAGSMLDFFFAFLMMMHLQETFWNNVYFMTLSWWSVLIYALSRMVTLAIVLAIRKYLPRDFSVRDCRIVFLLVAVGMCAGEILSFAFVAFGRDCAIRKGADYLCFCANGVGFTVCNNAVVFERKSNSAGKRYHNGKKRSAGTTIL